jgi:hypothetical protein
MPRNLLFETNGTVVVWCSCVYMFAANYSSFCFAFSLLVIFFTFHIDDISLYITYVNIYMYIYVIISL